jgi:ankyrin repeat protein
LCRAFPDSINELSQDGATALELACKNNHADTLSMLLSLGGDVKIHGGFGATALHRAVEQGALECARLLLLHDRSVVLEADDDGMTPLHYLAGNNKLSRSVLKDLVNLLTGVEPSLIDRTDYRLVFFSNKKFSTRTNSGATALIKASFYLKKPNGPFLVALLLEKGADPTIEYRCVPLFFFLSFSSPCSHGWSSAHIVHSEDETSELLPIMLSRFGPDKPFDPNKVDRSFVF